MTPRARRSATVRTSTQPRCASSVQGHRRVTLRPSARHVAANSKMPANTANGKETAMADKYDEMAQQMRVDGVDAERAKDEFLRGYGTTDIEAARTWRGMPESIRQLLLGNAFCPNCGTASFASGYSLRMRDGSVLIEGQVRHMRRRDRQALRLGPPVTARLDSPLASPAHAKRSRSSTL